MWVINLPHNPLKISCVGFRNSKTLSNKTPSNNVTALGIAPQPPRCCTTSTRAIFRWRGAPPVLSPPNPGIAALELFSRLHLLSIGMQTPVHPATSTSSTPEYYWDHHLGGAHNTLKEDCCIPPPPLNIHPGFHGYHLTSAAAKGMVAASPNPSSWASLFPTADNVGAGTGSPGARAGDDAGTRAGTRVRVRVPGPGMRLGVDRGVDPAVAGQHLGVGADCAPEELRK